MKFILLLAILPAFLFSSAQKNHDNVDGITSATIEWDKQYKFQNVGTKGSGLEIVYPFEGSVFPADFSPASFVWKNTDPGKTWNVIFQASGKKIKVVSDTCCYRPDAGLWEKLKSISGQKPILFSISDEDNEHKASVNFSFSSDSVNAPIFYRAVPLPFRYANNYRDQLEWYMGDVGTNSKRLMLNNMPVCANCHSFTKDGSMFGMDVDYANDKGNYAISTIENKSVISVNDIVSWSEYKKEDGEKTFGLLTQLSPDGKYAISTIKDQSIFVPVDKNFWYSQLFFPIKGILVVYNIAKDTFSKLSGASNKDFVQSSPAWSPDMKEIIFARSKTTEVEGLENNKVVIIGLKYAADYINREKDFKFDLYRVPWNDGKGGEAIPIEGASNNNKSNYFARYTPDGKWLVFCQAENFMLLQQDSRLYIMPTSGGGKPRLMNCNLDEMNSWHSFSPNGKWMLFSSKHFGPYTQLFLTHIDENGNDTPPVWLEQLTVPKKAANIPEFVNTDYDHWLGIEDGFTGSEKYLTDIVDITLQVGNYNYTLKVADEEIEKDPGNYYGYYVKARALIKAIPDATDKQKVNQEIYTNFRKCISLLNEELEKDNADADIYAHLTASYYFTRQISKALEYGEKTLSIDPDNLTVWEAFAGIYFEKGDYPKAIEANLKMFKLTEVPMYVNKCAQIKLLSGDVDEAIRYAEMALDADNCNDWTLEILGNCYITLKDFEKAERYYNNLVSCRPTEALAYYNRGKFYFMMEDYDSALNDLNESMTYNDKNWMALSLRAKVFQEKNENKKALEDLDKAIDLNKGNSMLWLLKAKSEFKINEFKIAKDNAQKAKELIQSSKSFNKDSFDTLFEISKIIKDCEEKLK